MFSFTEVYSWVKTSYLQSLAILELLLDLSLVFQDRQISWQPHSSLPHSNYIYKLDWIGQRSLVCSDWNWTNVMHRIDKRCTQKWCSGLFFCHIDKNICVVLAKKFGWLKLKLDLYPGFSCAVCSGTRYWNILIILKFSSFSLGFQFSPVLCSGMVLSELYHGDRVALSKVFHGFLAGFVTLKRNFCPK